MTRVRLPNRRQNETASLTFGGLTFTVTVGFYPDGRPAEVFASGAKSGSDLGRLLDDASVALSLLLQHGIDPTALTRSMGRAGDGATPASVIGALTDLLSGLPASDAPPSPASSLLIESEPSGLRGAPKHQTESSESPAAPAAISEVAP